jgi:hypothetical protein
MSDPREDDLRTTYDAVDDVLAKLKATEEAKQATRPGTPAHAELARQAKEQAETLRQTTAVESELADELEADPGAGPS